MNQEKLSEHEKLMLKMKHKLMRLKISLEHFELSVIDENVYGMTNVLEDMKREIENTYPGMVLKKAEK